MNTAEVFSNYNMGITYILYCEKENITSTDILIGGNITLKYLLVGKTQL